MYGSLDYVLLLTESRKPNLGLWAKLYHTWDEHVRVASDLCVIFTDTDQLRLRVRHSLSYLGSFRLNLSKSEGELVRML